VSGCGNSTDKTKGAIERVLKADENLAKARDNLSPKSAPSQVAWAIGACCDGPEKLAMADCPADFRVAYRQHTRAWRDTQAALKELPDSFLEGVFMRFLNRALRGDTKLR
jgi:hypothetical protein